ncbi:MAG: L-rhamnose isomerase [candidate division WOR-3 bacterium]|nr:L-rhamnose isomerase [candidate division WOR-3 bacterium]
MKRKIIQAYKCAREKYQKFGINTDLVIKKISKMSLSIHCWQGDDVRGFEVHGSELSGGIQVTGNYPGRARNIDELRQDIEKALSLIPGRHRVNLHSIYGDFSNKKVDRNEIGIEHFKSWVDWAKDKKIGLDFNATLFSHPFSIDGFTLSSKDEKIRKFWIEHVQCCREIAAYFGKALNNPSIHNLWIPDGMKDVCIDRIGYRSLLKDSLDKIFSKKYPEKFLKDSLEPKLFGIGSESFVTGSFEFYLSYALKNNLMLCLDLGHFHPTESVADKISSLLLFMKGILLHISRGVRWDSDHIPLFDDTLKELFSEIVRCNGLSKTHIGLDYFDATLNRVGALVLGARSVQKAILYALLEPVKILKNFEEKKDYLARLGTYESLKTMPFSAVWNYFCFISDVPSDPDWLQEIKTYDTKILTRRKN